MRLTEDERLALEEIWLERLYPVLGLWCAGSGVLGGLITVFILWLWVPCLRSPL